MRKTKVAFIQRGWEDNPGILWISAVLRQNGFSTEIWVEEKDTYQNLRRFGPSVVGYSCMTGQQQWVHDSILRVRAAHSNAKCIVGGPHPTFFPEMINDSVIDALCRGEGELSMLEFCEAVDEGRDFSKVSNLYFNLKGEIIRNPLRPQIKELDTLPFPDRSYYAKYKFLATNPYKIFITGRGCPFQCTFCFNHALRDLYGDAALCVRRHSVRYVIDELRHVRDRWGLDEVRFSDDHFALDALWLKEFAQAYALEIGRPYTVNARADILDEERTGLLKGSGCRLVCFGIETGDETLRNAILKKKVTDEQIIQASRLLKKYKIQFLASNIIGLPHETAQDAWKTIALNQRIKTDLPWFSLMQYYPGTEIHAQASAEGLLKEESRGRYFSDTALRQENVDELKNIHSFSIIASRWPLLTPLFAFLARRSKPNLLFRALFFLTYIWLSLCRAHLRPWRILRWGRYYVQA